MVEKSLRESKYEKKIKKKADNQKKKIMRVIGQDEEKQRGRINRMKRWVRSGDASVATIVTRVRKQIDTQKQMDLY